ncbi:hypothetical protein CMO93_00655 [Candidatus Woesearchaeota archaeon]|nr:hypothetical protein [Candidatus Woesearchaeota archaeon]|tara:strand:+ start:16048 stop:16986 length:939 start_codon:yes stop_codon:yes gene_type:complete
MKLFDDIELIDLGVYVNNCLIFSDFHIGYEEMLNKQGVMVPRFHFPEVIKRLDCIFSRLKGKNARIKSGTNSISIEKIIINGDLKHEFGRISEQEWRHTLRLLDYLRQHCKEIVLIKGNHDTILGPIAKKRDVNVVDGFVIEPIIKNSNKGKSIKNLSIISKSNNKDKSIKKFQKKQLSLKSLKIIEKLTLEKETIGKKLLKNEKNNILIIHGDKIPDKNLLKDVSTIIIGHEHPAVSIKEGPRVELFKAFLIGKWKRKNLIVLPSFNLVTEGSDIMKEKVLSPFLKNNLRNFKAVVVGDKLYGFGKVGDLS